MPSDGNLFRREETALVDSGVNQSAVMDCGFEALAAKPFAGYPCQLDATAVVDCNVNQAGAVDCGFRPQGTCRQMVIHVDTWQLLWCIPAFISLLSWTAGLRRLRLNLSLIIHVS